MSQISSLFFSINPSTGGYVGTVIIDYIQIGGTAPTLPDVTLSSPSNGATLSNPITLTATTTISNIQSVSFFSGTNLINTDLTSPYTYNWTNAALGSHTLTAVIHTNLGIVNTSSPVTITVAAPEINVRQGSTNIASGGSYNFGNVGVGSSSGAITFTIENTGGAVLNLTGTPKIALSGTNASEFSIDQSSTTATVAATTGTTTFTVTFSPTTAGTKSAVITIENNDSDEGTYTINLSATATSSTSTLNSLDNKVAIYPNPVNDRLLMSVSGLEGTVEYKVKNMQGSIIYESSVQVSDGTDIEVNTSGWSSGIYYLELSSANAKTIKKVVKQ
ncbi:MAG: choice-of-anchor D domain-containing protein [Cytophagaceae bacterium]|nr:choice-of-anchor D domain-containing protein [Cytophagaceae bacterium]MDW8455470.1 choice-of-anchor D domain-containing protein [Cytophagaceae bacterium]